MDKLRLDRLNLLLDIYSINIRREEILNNFPVKTQEDLAKLERIKNEIEKTRNDLISFFA